jgi:RHS repeat-associated protein
LRSGDTPNAYIYKGLWGYEQDADSRLYVRARHLDTAQGRWMSKDPIGFEAGDVNLYRYVGNDPINELSAILGCLGALD